MRARILPDAIHSIFLQSYGLAEKLLNRAHHLWKSVHFLVRCTHYVVSLTIFTGVLQPDTGRFDQGRTTSPHYTGGYDLIIFLRAHLANDAISCHQRQGRSVSLRGTLGTATEERASLIGLHLRLRFIKAALKTSYFSPCLRTDSRWNARQSPLPLS